MISLEDRQALVRDSAVAHTTAIDVYTLPDTNHAVQPTEPIRNLTGQQ